MSSYPGPEDNLPGNQTTRRRAQYAVSRGEAQGGVKVPPFPLISDADLRRARNDRAFRRELLAGQLTALIGALAAMKTAPEAAEQPLAGQLREGADLAVKLADLLKYLAATSSEPHQAA
jgi:hypothetical protein